MKAKRGNKRKRGKTVPNVVCRRRGIKRRLWDEIAFVCQGLAYPLIRIPERELACEFHCSHTAVRFALKTAVKCNLLEPKNPNAKGIVKTYRVNWDFRQSGNPLRSSRGKEDKHYYRNDTSCPTSEPNTFSSRRWQPSYMKQLRELINRHPYSPKRKEASDRYSG